MSAAPSAGRADRGVIPLRCRVLGHLDPFRARWGVRRIVAHAGLPRPVFAAVCQREGCSARLYIGDGGPYWDERPRETP